MSGAEHGRLLAHINASWTTQAIGAFVRLGAARALAAADGLTPAELADATTTHAPSLTRLLRALATISIVEVDETGRWRATATGRLLDHGKPGSLAAWAEFCAGASWDAWRGLDASVASGASQRQRANGAAGFAHLDADPQAAALFNEAMLELTAPIAEAFANAVDLRGATTIVDVGGGAGQLAAALLVRHPQLHAVVFDLAHAAAAAEQYAESRGVGARVSFVPGDFFVAVPADADAYLLKSVLHDWDDDACVRILGRVAAALPKAGRIYVIERLRAEPAGTGGVDRMIARSDLNMLVGTGGRERSEREFGALLAGAGLVAAPETPLSPSYASIEARLP